MQLSNAKAIVLNPNAEWNRVMSEENERQSLLRYGMILIFIVYALKLVLSFLFSMAISTFLHYSSLYLVSSIVVEFALTIASLYLVPPILGALAPSFGGKNDTINALKLFVFAATPAWLAESIGVIPVLGWLVLLAGGIYAVYLFWQHFADALSIPPEKKVGYVIVAVIILALVHIIIGAIGGAVAYAIAPYSFSHAGPY